MSKSFLSSCLAAAVLLGGIPGCGPKRMPPSPKLKNDGSDLSFTQIATQAKASGGLTIDAYELSIPAAKSTTITASAKQGRTPNHRAGTYRRGRVNT